jgi:hypothetical protein
VGSAIGIGVCHLPPRFVLEWDGSLLHATTNEWPLRRYLTDRNGSSKEVRLSTRDRGVRGDLVFPGSASFGPSILLRRLSTIDVRASEFPRRGLFLAYMNLPKQSPPPKRVRLAQGGRRAPRHECFFEFSQSGLHQTHIEISSAFRCFARFRPAFVTTAKYQFRTGTCNSVARRSSIECLNL